MISKLILITVCAAACTGTPALGMEQQSNRNLLQHCSAELGLDTLPPELLMLIVESLLNDHPLKGISDQWHHVVALQSVNRELRQKLLPLNAVAQVTRWKLWRNLRRIG